MADTHDAVIAFNTINDYVFVSRLLAEEGLSWRIEADGKKPPPGIALSSSPTAGNCRENILSQSANGGRSIRFHRADSQEEQDSILAFGEQRQLQSGMTTVLAYDYKSKKSIATSVPTPRALSGKQRVLEAYDDAGPYAFASTAEAERYGRLAMEALEARYQTWLGRGTVRSLSPSAPASISSACRSIPPNRMLIIAMS